MDETTTALLIQFAGWLWREGPRRIEADGRWERSVADLSPELQVALFARSLRRVTAEAAAIRVEGEGEAAKAGGAGEEGRLMWERPGMGELIAIVGFGQNVGELIEWAAKQYHAVTFSFEGTVSEEFTYRASVLSGTVNYIGNGPTPWAALCAAIGEEIQSLRERAK